MRLTLLVKVLKPLVVMRRRMKDLGQPYLRSQSFMKSRDDRFVNKEIDVMKFYQTLKPPRLVVSKPYLGDDELEEFSINTFKHLSKLSLRRWTLEHIHIEWRISFMVIELS